MRRQVNIGLHSEIATSAIYHPLSDEMVQMAMVIIVVHLRGRSFRPVVRVMRPENYSFATRSLSAFPTTVTDDNAIAAAAMICDSNRLNVG